MVQSKTQFMRASAVGPATAAVGASSAQPQEGPGLAVLSHDHGASGWLGVTQLLASGG